MKIAIGPCPITHKAYRPWVAKDVGDELTKRGIKVIYFYKNQPIPKSDIVLVVRKKINSLFLKYLKKRAIKIIFMPVDIFNGDSDASGIFSNNSNSWLGLYDGFMSHSGRLSNELKKYKKDVYFIDHYLKYKYNWEKGGSIISRIGVFEYIMETIQFIERYKLSAYGKIVLISNISKIKNKEVKKISNQYDIKYKNNNIMQIEGFEILEWSEITQKEILMQSKMVLDIKSSNFTHYKPPTKVQQYLASGIPCIVNKESYSNEYFLEKGFNLQKIECMDKLNYDEYMKYCQTHQKRFKEQWSLSNVATNYINIFKKILS